MVLLLPLGLVLLNTVAKAATVFKVGQQIQVREGDTWSAATVVAHEGRKYQIHYEGSDASDDEWVTADRMRATATDAPTATPANPAPAPANTAQVNSPAPETTGDGKLGSNAGFKIGENIEAKWGGLWRKASVVRKSKDWTLVIYDNVWYEWVQPWRLREINSGEDTALDSSPRKFVSEFEPAPTQTPEELSAAHAAPRRHGRTDDADAGTDAFHISETVGPGGIAITKVDPSGHEIGITPVSGNPLPDNSGTTVANKMFPLGHGKYEFGAKLDLLLAAGCKFAAISLKPMDNRQPASVQMVDLSAGKASKIETLADDVVALAVNPQGTRVVTRSDKFFPGTKWRLDLWDANSESEKPLLSFRPYAASAGGSDEILWASFLDAGHLLTCSKANNLKLWRISDTSVQLIYQLQADSTVTPRLSNGGKYVIAGYAGDAVVCDALTGKCAGKCSDVTQINSAATDVTSDVTKLAMCGANRLIVCDIQHDKVELDLGLPPGCAGTSVDWLNSNLLLIDGRWIFDTARHAMLWEFTSRGKPPTTRFANGRLWMVIDADSAALASINPLSPAVLDADKQLHDGEFAIQSGASVSLQINLSCSVEDNQKITEALTRRLEKAGYIVADNQPTQLVVADKDTNARQVTYRGRGIDRSQETVTISNNVESLSFVTNSKPIWTVNATVYGNAPMVVFHKANESIAQTLAKQKKSHLDWFTTVGVPRGILKPADPIGSSPLAEAATDNN